MCGILKCLYSCRWLLIFSSVVSVSEWVMLVYMFCSKLNVSFSKLEWESWKFVLVFFFFHLFHYFSLVVGVEKSLLSLANENMWTIMNSLVWEWMGQALTVDPGGEQEMRELSPFRTGRSTVIVVFTLHVWELRNAIWTASTCSQKVVMTACGDVSACFNRSMLVCHGLAMDKLRPGT